MRDPKPRVLTIPPGRPFLPTLADALAEGRLLPGFSLDDPLEAARATIYLPTRRAARALAALMAERGGTGARLLPRIVPLGEAEGAELDLAGGSEAGFEDGAVLAPPIAPLERRLILSRLVQHWSAAVDRDRLGLEPGIPFMVPASPADAVNLAGDLEALMDAFTTEDVPWDDLAHAVETDFSKYFEITLEFVRIAAQSWPVILEERGASDPARRRRLLVEAEARRLARERPADPVIVAGSTGSIPATARLLAAIARLPNGAVVLPGLDHDLDGTGWEAIGAAHRRGLASLAKPGSPAEHDGDLVHGHPQAMLHRLLQEHLGIARTDVETLGEVPEAAAARNRLLSEALRPADTTDSWASFDPAGRLHLARRGTDGLALIEAADEREEALAIAVALRETIAEPGRTAALVTPNRALAERVATELRRWGLDVEDSAGVSLADSEAGRLARLAAEAAAEDFDPARLLALLAHPTVRLGWPRATLERAAAALEIGVLRGPAPAPGLDGISRALAARRAEFTRHTPRPRRRLTEEDWALVGELLDRLTFAFVTFTVDTHGHDVLDLVALAEHHRAAVEALMDPGAGEGASPHPAATDPPPPAREASGGEGLGVGGASAGLDFSEGDSAAQVGHPSPAWERGRGEGGAYPDEVRQGRGSIPADTGREGSSMRMHRPAGFAPQGAPSPPAPLPTGRGGSAHSWEWPCRAAPPPTPSPSPPQAGGGNGARSGKDEGIPQEENESDGSAEALASLFDDLALAASGPVAGRFRDYPHFFLAVARTRTLSLAPRASHRRLKILGLLEARLLSVDRVVLGGLDEGVWPPRVQTDAFLNRPMRARVGLSPPERRIGQTAHDFVQALGCRDAVITRAAKRDDAPTVPSRFLQRLKAFAGEEAYSGMREAGERYRRLAATLDAREPEPVLPRPAPKPDPALFPRSLSVTEVETLVRDPYSIFARHVLRLDPLDPLAVAPGAADRGTLIHDILGTFAADHPRDLPAGPLMDLLQRGQNAFAPIEDAYPELYAAWWPRFERVAEAFVVWETERRSGLRQVHPEVSGALSFPLPDGSLFKLRARADRIEERLDGGFTIVDFKTGQPPGLREVFAGFAPQLTLEAAMLMSAAFVNLPAAAETPDLLYVQLTGGREPLRERLVEPGRGEERTVPEIVAEHRRRLEGLVARFAAGEAAYVSRPFPKYARKYSDYDHLARVKEWSLASAGSGEAEAG